MKENPEFLKRLTKVSKLITAQKILPSAVRAPVKRSKNLINTNFFEEFHKEIKASESNPKNLNLLYSLLNIENEDATKFWRAFSYFKITRNPADNIPDSFTFQQIMSLFKIVVENHKSNDNKESEKLLNSMKHFISSSGLLQKTTQNYFGSYIANDYSARAGNDWSIFAVENVQMEILDDIALQYKTLLLQALLEFNGIITMKKVVNVHQKPFKSDIELLEELGLVVSKESFFKNDNVDLEWLKPAFVEVNKGDDTFAMDTHPLSDLENPQQLYGDRAWDNPYEEVLRDHSYRIRTIHRELSEFSNIISPQVLAIKDGSTIVDSSSFDDREGTNSITFDEMIYRFSIDTELDMTDFSIGFDYLINVMKSHEKAIGQRDLLLGDLALLTGLTNQRSIANEISKKEKKILAKVEKGYGDVTFESGVNWLKDEERRNPWFEPVVSTMFLDDITLEFINSLTD